MTLRPLIALLSLSSLACATTGLRPAPSPAPAPVSTALPADAPRDPASLAAAGEAALKRNDFKMAEALLASAAKQAPGDARTQALLATAVFWQARFQEALTLAQASLEKGETYAARFVEGRVSAIARKLEDAVRAYERCTVLQPRNPEGWSALVAVRLASGDADGAQRAWDALAGLEDPVKLPLKAEDRVWTDILRVPPDPFEVQEALDRCSRGTAAYVAGRYAEAAWELRTVILSIPSFAHSWTEYGKALVKLARPDEADQAFRTALAAYRTDQEGLKADTQALLARLLLDQKKSATEALTLARAAKEVRGDRADVVAVLELACARTKDPACARPVAGQRAPAAAEAPAAPNATAKR